MFEVFTGTGKCQQGSGQVPKESQGAGWSINSGRMSIKVGRSKKRRFRKKLMVKEGQG